MFSPVHVLVVLCIVTADSVSPGSLTFVLQAVRTMLTSDVNAPRQGRGGFGHQVLPAEGISLLRECPISRGVSFVQNGIRKRAVQKHIH